MHAGDFMDNLDSSASHLQGTGAKTSNHLDLWAQRNNKEAPNFLKDVFPGGGGGGQEDGYIPLSSSQQTGQLYFQDGCLGGSESV